MKPATGLAIVWLCFVVAFSTPDAEEVVSLEDLVSLVELRESLSVAQEQDAAATSYVKLPAMKIDFKGKTVKSVTQDGCAGACDQEPTCRGYSWSKAERACVWTSRPMDYDFRWRSWVSSAKGWYSVDGLLLQRITRELDNRDQDFCEGACKHDPECKGFVYSDELKKCRISSEDYDAYSNRAFDFFEKRGQAHTPAPAPLVAPLASPAVQLAKGNLETKLKSLELASAQAVSNEAKAKTSLEALETQKGVAKNITIKAELKVADMKKQGDQMTAKLKEKYAHEAQQAIARSQKTLDLKYEAAKAADDMALEQTIRQRKDAEQAELQAAQQHTVEVDTTAAHSEEARAKAIHLARAHLLRKQHSLNLLRAKVNQARAELDASSALHQKQDHSGAMYAEQLDLLRNKTDLEIQELTKESLQQVKLAETAARMQEQQQRVANAKMEQDAARASSDLMDMAAKQRLQRDKITAAGLAKRESLQAALDAKLQLKREATAAQEAEAKRLLDVQTAEMADNRTNLIAELSNRLREARVRSEKLLAQAQSENSQQMLKAHQMVENMKVAQKAAVDAELDRARETAIVAANGKNAVLQQTLQTMRWKARNASLSFQAKSAALTEKADAIMADTAAAHNAFLAALTGLDQDQARKMHVQKLRSDAKESKLRATWNVRRAIVLTKLSVEKTKAKLVYEVNLMRQTVDNVIAQLNGLKVEMPAALTTYVSQGKDLPTDMNLKQLEVARVKYNMSQELKALGRVKGKQRKLVAGSRALKMALAVLVNKWTEQNASMAARNASLEDKIAASLQQMKDEWDKLRKLGGHGDGSNLLKGTYFSLRNQDESMWCSGQSSDFFEQDGTIVSTLMPVNASNRTEGCRAVSATIESAKQNRSASIEAGKRQCDQDSRCVGVQWYPAFSTKSVQLCYGKSSGPSPASATVFIKSAGARKIIPENITCDSSQDLTGTFLGDGVFSIQNVDGVNQLSAGNTKSGTYVCCADSADYSGVVQCNKHCASASSAQRQVVFHFRPGLEFSISVGGVPFFGNNSHLSFTPTLMGMTDLPLAAGPTHPAEFTPTAFKAEGGTFEPRFPPDLVAGLKKVEELVASQMPTPAQQLEGDHRGDHFIKDFDKKTLIGRKCEKWCSEDPAPWFKKQKGKSAPKRKEKCSFPQCSGCFKCHSGAWQRKHFPHLFEKEEGRRRRNRRLLMITQDLEDIDEEDEADDSSGDSGPSPTPPPTRRPTSSPTTSPTPVGGSPKNFATEIRLKKQMANDLASQIKEQRKAAKKQAQILFQKRSTFERKYKHSAHDLRGKSARLKKEIAAKRYEIGQAHSEQAAVQTAERSQEASTKAEKTHKEGTAKSMIRMRHRRILAGNALLVERQQELAQAMQQTGNTVLATLSANQDQLILSAGSSPSRAFLSFDTEAIAAENGVVRVTLQVYKIGGAASGFQVASSACSWTKSGLTWGMTNDIYTGAQIGGGSFTDANNEWVSVTLDARKFEELRSRSRQVCFVISGGPSNNPVILGSEQSKNPPKLVAAVIKNPARKQVKAAPFSTPAHLAQLEAQARERVTTEQRQRLREEVADGLMDQNSLEEELALAVKTKMSEWRQQIVPASVGQMRTKDATRLEAIAIQITMRESAADVGAKVEKELLAKYVPLATESALTLFKEHMEKRARAETKEKVYELLQGEIAKYKNSRIGRVQDEIKKARILYPKLSDRVFKFDVIPPMQLHDKEEVRTGIRELKLDPKLQQTRENVRFAICNRIYPQVQAEAIANATKHFKSLMHQQYRAVGEQRAIALAQAGHQQVKDGILSRVRARKLDAWLDNHLGGDFTGGKGCLQPYCSDVDKAPFKLPSLKGELIVALDHQIPFCETYSPTIGPSQAPTFAPTGRPSAAPTAQPSVAPTKAPTDAPTSAPTKAPTEAPTEAPTTAAPTATPTSVPTKAPTTAEPTAAPTTAAPTDKPTNAPTKLPTGAPTTAPPTSSAPTTPASHAPTSSPTVAPTSATGGKLM